MNDDVRFLLEDGFKSLGDRARNDLKAFHVFFESIEEEFDKRLYNKLRTHPLFRNALFPTMEGQWMEQRKTSLEIQREAIFNNNWGPYIEEHNRQGIAFAREGVHFFEWYGLIALFRNTIRPMLFDESNMDISEIVGIMRGKNHIFDIRMCIVAEAYLKEKNRVIEEQKLSLSRSEERLNQAQAIAHIGSWEADVEKKLTWSDETFRILGFEPGEVEPSLELFLSTILPEDLKEAKVIYRSTEYWEKPHHLTHRLRRKDGEIRVVRTENRALFNADGEYAGTWGILEDITEKERFVKENQRLSNVIQKSLNEIYIFNYDTLQFEYVNEEALRNLGYSWDEMKKKTLENLIPKYTPTKFGKLVDFLDGAEEDKIVFETEIKRKDGSRYPVEIHLQLMKEGYKKSFVAIINDITERKKSEKMIKRNADLLAFQNTQLIDFCNIVSHNLRSPLANMNLLIDLIGESEEGMAQHILIDKLRPIVNNINETFNELLESLQIQQDLKVKSEKLVIREYFRNIIKGFEGQVIQNNAVIETDFGEAPEVHYPPKYFSSLLHNLISNALKYHDPDRSPHISLKSRVSNGNIILSIQDNGLGIDLDKHRDDMFKIRKVFHHHPDAKGFGLYITKTQVETMGGRIWVESQPGEGSTFYVEFKHANGGRV